MKELSRRQMIWASIGLTVLLELITVILRFGFGLESTRDTASTIGVLTGGLRIHHGYVGALFMLLAYWRWETWMPWSQWLMIVGIALVMSDLIHHFLVLWPITGSPHFDFFYSLLRCIAPVLLC